MALLSQSSTGPNRRWVFPAHWHQNQNAGLRQKSAVFWMACPQPLLLLGSPWLYRGGIFPVTLGYPGPGTHTAGSPVSLWALEPCLTTEVRETLPGAASYAPKTKAADCWRPLQWARLFVWTGHTQNSLRREIPSSTRALKPPLRGLGWGWGAVLSLKHTFFLGSLCL